LGGGYAAFLDRAAADGIAAAKSGQVARLAEFAAGAAAPDSGAAPRDPAGPGSARPDSSVKSHAQAGPDPAAGRP